MSVLDLFGASLAVQVVTCLLVWFRTSRPSPVRSDEDAAPKWGTPARKAWHRQQRDYHAEMVLKAAEAVQRESQ